MPKPKVLVVYKESAYSRYLSSAKLLKGLKKTGYWKVVEGSHLRHQMTLKTVLRDLQEEGFRVETILRSRIGRQKSVDKKFRLVVTVGGDGTLLDASHLVGKTPVLGVNSDPSRSVARFSGCRGENFRSVLREYLQGKLGPARVPRLQFSLNGVKAGWLVLNDLLVTTLSPAGTTRYILKVGGRVEEQMSSGVWISTAAGSTAAILSAGGRALPVSAKKFQYVVREAYQRKFGTRKILKGILGGGQVLEVVSRMKEGRVFVDGASLFLPFKTGDRLKVRLSNQPLNLIGLKK